MNRCRLPVSEREGWVPNMQDYRQGAQTPPFVDLWSKSNRFLVC